jgi:hypothetical protein
VGLAHAAALNALESREQLGRDVIAPARALNDMADPDTQKSDLTILDSLSKCVAVAVGVLYLLGFLVVSAHLSRYGVSSFSVLQLQYLIAGGWVLGPPIVFISFYTGAMFQERAAPIISGKFNWRRFLFACLLTAIPIAISSGLLVAIPGITENFTWGMGIRLFLFYLAMWSSGQRLFVSWRVQPEKETWLVNRHHGAPFYLTLLITLVLGYVFWFSARIYPLIPFSLGGGRPLKVAFIVGEKKLPDAIKVDISLKRSIPYELLVTTDRSYVVLSQDPNEKSIEVSRDSVAGIVVLEELHAQ